MRPGICTNEVMLQTRLEILPLSNFLEEGKAHFCVLDGYVSSTQQHPGVSGAVGGAEASRQESQGATGALEVGNRRPAFPHDIDEVGMKGIGRLDAVSEHQAFVFGLVPLGIALCVGTPHLGKHITMSFRRTCGSVLIRNLAQQPALDHIEDLIPFDRLPALVLARCKVFHGLQQTRVFQRLPLARLQ